LDSYANFKFVHVDLGEEELADLGDCAHYIEGPLLQVKCTIFEHAQVEHVVDEAAHELKVIEHQLAKLGAFFKLSLARGILHQHNDHLLDNENDSQDGCPHLVVHRGCEVLGLLNILVLFLFLHFVEFITHLFRTVADIQRDGGPSDILLFFDSYRDKF